MILLLGASGYVGQFFSRKLEKMQIKFTTASVRHPLNVIEFIDFAEKNNIKYVINCSAYTGTPNIAACELNDDTRHECLVANAFLPLDIAKTCNAIGIKYGHVSTGCIYDDEKCAYGEQPSKIYGEFHRPNFSFRQRHCSWYSGTKALGEELLNNIGGVYIWRMRLPFSSIPSQKNIIDKYIKFPQLLNTTNSYTNLDEFVGAALKTFEVCEDANGSHIFNLTQPGFITTQKFVQLLLNAGIINDDKKYMSLEEYVQLDPIPRANCALSTSKAESYGIGLKPIQESINDALSVYKTLIPPHK